MSDPFPLADVTALLQSLLSGAAKRVTARPPGVARKDEEEGQINIFLYSVRDNPMARNTSAPRQAYAGEQELLPSSWVLNYLVTTYGANGDDISGHQLMGEAINILQNHPKPDTSGMEGIQVVRITREALNPEYMARLWTSFRSDYRLSVSFEVSVDMLLRRDYTE